MPHTKATHTYGIIASGSKSRQKNCAVSSLVRFAVPSYKEGSDESDASDGQADVREAQWAGEARFLAVCCSSVQAQLPIQGQQLDLTWQPASKKQPLTLHKKPIRCAPSAACDRQVSGCPAEQRTPPPISDTALGCQCVLAVPTIHWLGFATAV